MPDYPRSCAKVSQAHAFRLPKDAQHSKLNSILRLTLKPLLIALECGRPSRITESFYLARKVLQQGTPFVPSDGHLISSNLE